MTTLIGPSLLDPSLFIQDLKTRRRAAVLQELVACAHRAGAVRDPEALCDALTMRERLSRSALGKGVAVPHARSIAVIDARLVIARSRRGIDWDAPDGAPVQLVLMPLSPSDWTEDAHVDFVSQAATAVRQQRSRVRLLEAGDFDGVAEVFVELQG